MSLEELASKYIASAEHVFGTMEIVESCACLSMDSVKRVVESARAYLQDAKYYMEKKRFEVSLASIAYCEGLLDALKILGTVKFEWPTRKEERRRKER